MMMAITISKQPDTARNIHHRLLILKTTLPSLSLLVLKKPIPKMAFQSQRYASGHEIFYLLQRAKGVRISSLSIG